jgi:histidyl-tRNA synthetase
MQKPKGTVDIPPALIRGWQQLEEAIKSLTHLYHIQEIRTPLFETTEVFHRSVGELSDIVTKETYTFLDRGGRSMTLRPEGTAGIVRSVIEQKLYIQPQKLYYTGPMFRYERPQAGRQRQFHQFGVEYFGYDDAASDAEVIAFAVTWLELLGVQEYALKLNYLGNESTKARYTKALVDYFTPIKDQLSSDNQARLLHNPLRILDDASMDVSGVPSIQSMLTAQEVEYMNELTSYLDALHISYTLDPRIVRGLDYYTGMVFEVQSTHPSFGSQTALLGGGRYDRLVQEFGGPITPAVGFAAGLERVLLAMEYEGVLDVAQDLIDVAVCFMPETTTSAFSITQSIRLSGYVTEMAITSKNLSSQLKQANKKQPKAIVIVAADEWAKQQVLVKVNGQQQSIPVDQLIDYLDGVMEDAHETHA